MSNGKQPRHLAERVAAQLLPGTLPDIGRIAGAKPPLGGEARIASAPLPAIPLGRPADPQPRLVDIDRGQAEERPRPRPSSLPASGTISRKTMEEAGMVVSRSRRDQAGEEFRIVRQHILQSLAAGDANAAAPACRNVVMITSAKHGEGKSFTALNLANILAEGGERPVLLIDADIGNRSLSRHFGMEDRPGLLDIGNSPRQLGHAVQIPTESDNLSFVPIGGGADATGRGDLSSRQPVRSLIEILSTRFRDSILVVDSPACLSNSDPMELSAVVGQIVLVIEAGQTRRKEVEGALDLIDSCQNISLLLNRMTQRDRGSFGLKG